VVQNVQIRLGEATEDNRSRNVVSIVHRDGVNRHESKTDANQRSRVRPYSFQYQSVFVSGIPRLSSFAATGPKHWLPFGL